MDWSRYAEADVLIVGEVHDNPHHHVGQARAVQELAPAALVFEMLTPELAAKVTPELLGNAATLDAALDWEGRGWPDFSMYYPIFSSAPDAAIFGGAVARADVRRAVSEGAAAVFGGGASAFGLDVPLPDDEQAAREAGQQVAHCNALPPDILGGMVEAQRLRDAALARATLAALAESEARGVDAPVIVITGNGHARRDRGVPVYLEGRGLTVVSIGQFETAAPEAPAFDAWIVTDAAERPDPCEAFR